MSKKRKNKGQKKGRKTVSQKQLAANRQNALLSTGPTSEEGKRTSSRNATKHGCYGGKVLLATESAEDFDEFYAGLWAHLAPENALERMFVDDFIWECWRIRRLRVNEAQLTEEMADASTRELLHELSRLSVLKMRTERSRDKAFKQFIEHRARMMAQFEQDTQLGRYSLEEIHDILAGRREVPLKNGQNPPPPNVLPPAQTDPMGSFRETDDPPPPESL